MFLALLPGWWTATTQRPMQDLEPIAKGPFVGTLESLRANRYPKWFTDGKLGIWAHWGPQAVPMRGDWYARRMYQKGDKDYGDNLEHRGHPSKSGYKDVIPLWKAENWDPDRLMGLYKAAGAKYFVSMAAHHDNFDLWDSHRRWNSVNMGPHRDVVSEWQRAAKRHGLRFGVSEHLGASWTWFQTAHGSDEGGAYDGNDPAYEDLYHPKALPGDTGWYTTDPRWHREWYARVKDLIDQHHPDLLYTDGGLPFGEVGASIVAHLYNVNREAVYNCKQGSDGRWVQDVERGVLGGIQPYPWQTDTSIGDWYYDRDWKYRDAAWVIHTLIDAVSKNGNLLINVVQRPDGSLDPQAETILADMAAWMRTNGESIYGTCPWVAYGEGPTRAKGGAFKEDFAFTGADVRYAQKGGTLYATFLGRPAHEATLALLARRDGDTGRIERVSLLGSTEKVEWRQDGRGLHLTLPATSSAIANVLRIEGHELRGFAVPKVEPAGVSVDQMGDYHLTAALAEVHGSGLNTEERGSETNLGFWDSPSDWASWNVEFARAGTFEVLALVAAPETSTLRVELESKSYNVPIPATGAWDRFVEVSVGRFEVAREGSQTIAVHPGDGWKPINLRGLVLRQRR